MEKMLKTNQVTKMTTWDKRQTMENMSLLSPPTSSGLQRDKHLMQAEVSYMS